MTPAFRSIAGEKEPRLLVWHPEASYTSSTQTVYTDVIVYEMNINPAQRFSVGDLLWARYGSDPPRDSATKIIKLDNYTGGAIWIDGWTNGIPTAGSIFYIQGRVIDLPMPQRFRETFEPDYLIHELWAQQAGTRTEQRLRGWKYRAELDYSRSIEADTIIQLGDALKMHPDSRLVFIPHRDKPQYNHNVRYDGAIDIEPFGLGAGHKSLRLNFVGTENVASFPMATSGYGFGYGYTYGQGL